MDKDKIKLDDSILEDIDADINIDELKANQDKKKSIFDEEISMDDLFDFKPRGYVGDADEFLESAVSQKEPSKPKFKTKKQKLEAILDDKDEFIDITNPGSNFKVEEEFYPNNSQTSKEPIVEQKNIASNKNSVTKNNKEPKVQKVSNNYENINEEEVLFQNQNVHDFNEYHVQTENDEYDPIKIRSLIESALYICGNDGVSIGDLRRLTGISVGEIKKIMKQWINELEADDKRGITIKIYGERYKILSKASNREDLSRLITVRYRNPLSSKVMETLAIIAYNQPCTRSVIESIRGKDPTVTIQKLIDLGLIIEAGRADTPGRPLLYTVTHKFYDIFGIKNLNELPKININQPFDDSDISFFDTTRYND